MKAMHASMLGLGLLGLGQVATAKPYIVSQHVSVGDAQYSTNVQVSNDDYYFETLLKGSYCGSCQDTLSQSVSCDSGYSITKDELAEKLMTQAVGSVIDEQLKILDYSVGSVKRGAKKQCYNFRLGFEDVPVGLYDQGPACRLNYKDYNDMYLDVVVCEDIKRPFPDLKVSLEVKDWFGTDLKSNGTEVTEVPRCGLDRSATYALYLKGDGRDVSLAKEGVQWKIFHDAGDDKHVYSHFNEDPSDWVNTAKLNHIRLKTSDDQDQEYMLDCEGHQTCFLALPCMYKGRGVLRAEAILKNGTVLKKNFSAKGGIWENRHKW